nr:MAG TPA: hypothetical protein [Caudoviricetes sp.]
MMNELIFKNPLPQAESHDLPCYPTEIILIGGFYQTIKETC